jgi:hypothetical protein
MSTLIHNEKNWTRIPVSELTDSTKGGLHMIYRNSWWAIDAENRVFFYKITSPQCNSDKRIVERLKTHPDMVGIVQIPLAMWPVSISDYF